MTFLPQIGPIVGTDERALSLAAHLSKIFTFSARRYVQLEVGHIARHLCALVRHPMVFGEHISQ